ncbi:hypothetical protein [Kribbella sp. DT2]|uniref:hypothetical protein n=1 Tax=Kribbella sp. DT2 TaxID=3393427 RepID=UPI003CEA55FB
MTSTDVLQYLPALIVTALIPAAYCGLYLLLAALSIFMKDRDRQHVLVLLEGLRDLIRRRK